MTQEPETDSLSHSELNRIACKWLLSLGCSIVLSELKTWGTFEIADAIGFKSSYSILVESKTSRANFLADKKKPWRMEPASGMGNYRLFLCQQGIIKPDDLPNKWGLIYSMGNKIRNGMS